MLGTYWGNGKGSELGNFGIVKDMSSLSDTIYILAYHNKIRIYPIFYLFTGTIL